MKSIQEAPLARYVREYSALPGLQQANSVEYTLRRSAGMLCFSARRKSDAAPVSFYTAAFEEGPACQLLCYLYENSIAPEQMYDVLSDLCGRAL
jgi:hypothetical protein